MLFQGGHSEYYLCVADHGDAPGQVSVVGGAQEKPPDDHPVYDNQGVEHCDDRLHQTCGESQSGQA